MTNQISGKKYVGQTILSLKKRWRGHCDDSKRKNTPFYAAIRKYGVGAFAVEALCDVPDDNPSLLDALEDWYIQYHNSLHPKGYNLSVEGALHLTKNSIDKMSKSLTGRKLTPEHKKNIGIASKKRWDTPGYKDRLSHIQSAAHSGILLTAEHCAHISKGKIGKPWSEKRRAAQQEKSNGTFKN